MGCEGVCVGGGGLFVCTTAVREAAWCIIVVGDQISLAFEDEGCPGWIMYSPPPQ